MHFNQSNLPPLQDTGVLLLCVFLPPSGITIAGLTSNLPFTKFSKPCVSAFILWNRGGLLICTCLIDTVVLWDWIISLPREWRYVGVSPPHQVSSYGISQIWKTSWTPVKIAYLFCRYGDSKHF